MDNEAGAAFTASKNSNGNVDQDNRQTYSIPGILHFIQHEWTKFEMERAHWEVERAELQARIAFLQGERRGQENLKRDLVRRIKMLEYALRQERQKYHKLKYGSDVKLQDISDDLPDEEQETGSTENLVKANNFNYRQGRQILRQYLQEIGYIDKVVELRSARVKMLLGISGDEANSQSTESANVEPHSQSPARIPSAKTENHEVYPQPSDEGIHEPPKVEQVPPRKTKSPPVANKQPRVEGVSEEAVNKSFNFLQREVQEEGGEERDDGGNADDELDDKEYEDIKMAAKKAKQEIQNDVIEKIPSTEGSEIMREFEFLAQEENNEEAADGVSHNRSQDEWSVDQSKLQKQIEQYKNERKAMGRKGKRPNRTALQSMLAKLEGEEEIPPPPSAPAPPVPANQNISRPNSTPFVEDVAPLGDVVLPSSNYAARPVTPGHLKDTPSGNDAMDVALRLGDLADLTVSNEAGPLSVDINSKEDVRKTWSPKYTLRSHFDGVRSLAFHPYESALITGSEDHTLKVWSLQRNSQMKKGNISDIEPVYTFRGHSGPVLCLTLNSNGSVCYSGGVDATIQWWNIPPLMLDLFGSYDPSIAGETLVAHTDAVWDLALQSDTDRLLSCSADGTCRLWNPAAKSPLLCTYRTENENGNPTAVTFSNTDVAQMIASYTTSECICYDLETAKSVLKFESAKTYNGTPLTQINKVVAHPTLPVIITAHEDRHIRFFDINSGKQIHTMVAHLDAVTSLSIDPTGLYLLSGSHDGSIRLWNMDNKTCIQEITAHRKKFDEAVFDVAFHPSQPFIASGGGDAVAKVFV